jgi:CheY-like chemotaxis protein
MDSQRAAPRLLIIDHSPARRLVVVRLLILAGYAVVECARTDQALLQIDHHRPQLILLNPLIAATPTCRMVIFWAHQQRPPIPVVLLLTQPPEVADATPLDADGWVSAPVTYEQLIVTIRRLV